MENEPAVEIEPALLIEPFNFTAVEIELAVEIHKRELKKLFCKKREKNIYEEKQKVYIIHKLMVCCSANDDCCHVPGEFYEGNYTEGCILLRSYYCGGSRGNARGSQIPHGAHSMAKVLKPPAILSVELRGFHWTLEPSHIRPVLLFKISLQRFILLR